MIALSTALGFSLLGRIAIIFSGKKFAEQELTELLVLTRAAVFEAGELALLT